MSALAPIVIPAEFEARVLRNEPMAKHTSWHVGGPADVFFKPRDRADLLAFLQGVAANAPLYWIGLGSNLLVRDGGLRGVVIATHGALGEIERARDNEIHAGAGVACAKLAKQCTKWGLAAGEFFAGIPGTVGGALAMNAGAFGGETWRHVLEVETVDRRGTCRKRAPTDFTVAYRHVVGPADEWFMSARLTFVPSATASPEDIRALLARRKASQPIGELSCGSVFTNPPGDHAARLIDTAGLKGLRIGGAHVSMKHANFIINDAQASASDIESLIARVQAAVKETHGVELHPEVRVVGEARQT